MSYYLWPGTYLAKTEKEFALPEGRGFEQHFKAKGGTLKRRSAYAFWVLLFLLSVFIPLAYKA